MVACCTDLYKALQALKPTCAKTFAMDWDIEEVAHWLKEIGLSKYSKRFKGL